MNKLNIIKEVERPKNKIRVYCETMVGDADGENKEHLDFDYPLSEEDEQFINNFYTFIIEYRSQEHNRKCEIDEDPDILYDLIFTEEQKQTIDFCDLIPYDGNCQCNSSPTKVTITYFDDVGKEWEITLESNGKVLEGLIHI